MCPRNAKIHPDKSNVGTRLSGGQVNLKLGLVKSRKDSWQSGTSHADTDEDDVSLAGVLQDAVGRTVRCVFAVLGR